MPELSELENDWLKRLGSEEKMTLRTRDLRQLSVLIHRLMNEADNALAAKRKSDILANGFWLIGSGKVDEQMIYANPHLTERERDDMLAMLQLRFDAVQWREHCGFALPALPSVEPSTTTETSTSLPSLRSDG